MVNEAPLLNVDGISKNYRYKNSVVEAVTSASFTANRRELVAVTGASGSGKSTLLSIIGGLLTPDVGNVQVAAEDPYSLSQNGRAAWRATHIGFLFQNFNLLPFLSALDNVCAYALAATGDQRPSRKAVREQAMELLERFQISDRKNHPPNRLSAGEQQRVALARAVVGKPSLILADEPTGNLDAESTDLAFSLLKELAEEGLAVVVVTHDERANTFADRILRMDSGRLTDAKLSAGSGSV